jgi:cytochrome oxidase assembly protein ShyY1
VRRSRRTATARTRHRLSAVFLSLLRTRRWLGFTAVVVGAIVAFGLLSRWQWSRADEKRLQRVELQTAMRSEPVPLTAIEVHDGRIAPEDQWRAVQVSGRYLPASQALVRKRPLNAQNGFWAMAAMESDDGTVVWVNRGWLPTAGDALSTPPTPPLPTSPVVVTGYLRPFEDADPAGNAGLPAGQVAAPAPALLPLEADAYAGYVQLSESNPAQTGLTPLPVPEIDEGQNVSYAVQWLIFAGVALGGWFFFLRREAIEDAERALAPAGAPGVEED